jgi:2-methylcitrate dehydratase PrpD
MPSTATMNGLLAIAAIERGEIGRKARRFADFSLFDWLLVSRAGTDQRVSVIIRNFIEEAGGKSSSTVVGSRMKVPARSAALANGTISHALDYDDTHFAHVGHPSAAIFPAALAVGEEMGASACDVRDAFLLGAEASCRFGMVLGRSHYEHGFHQTATAGAIGATLAAGRLYDLSPEQYRMALSLVSTRASGLKSQFGTMGKPFNAGMAAANGVEAADLARRGFISCDDGLGGPQGFIETHCENPDSITPWIDPPPGVFVFEGIKYKLHACCHGAHAMIEALRIVLREHEIAPDAVVSLDVTTNPRWLKVCDIKSPRTGLEAKFSYGLLAAMVLEGLDTTSDAVFDDALCGQSRVQRLAQRVRVTSDSDLSDTQTAIVLDDGRNRHRATYDIARPLSDLEIERGLRRKAKGLVGEATAEALWASLSGLDRLSAMGLAALLQD